jgi:uncharacterized membrane protein YqjE
MDVRRAETGRSVTDVLVAILSNIQDILRSEIRLAQSEVRDDLARACPAAVLVVAAFAGAVLSALFLLIAIQYALRFLLPAWAAALCVAVTLAIIAAIAMSIGVRRLRAQWSARATREQVKESMGWAREPRK